MRRTLGLAAAAALVSVGLPVTPALAQACDSAVNNTYKKLLDCVSLEGAREHQAALQAIADANNGIRTSGTPGYDQSAAYAADVFRKAGYQVTVQEFTFQTFIVNSQTVLEQVSPAPGGPIETNIMAYSGSGSVTADVSQPVVNADTGLPTGCVAADFAGFPAGDIALISRGACPFALKAANAAAAGAAGVVIYNNATGVLNGTLGAEFDLDIAVTSVTQEVGQQLAALVPGGLVLRLVTDTFRGEATTSNVIAETKGGNPNNVVMAGAHLDSVNAGPGIQDNGSGTGAILETAQALARANPVNKVRFALWGAEESGLVGSEYYVGQLSPSQIDDIALYLNFDMIGSPNHVFFIYDGDDSDAVGNGAGPDGSAAIEQLFEGYYSQIGQPFKGTDFSGRSDYGPFIAAGVDIPSGGLFTGAEGIKTPEEAQLWGGTAGEQYDPCYHLACDTYDNINLQAYAVNVDAVAYAVLTYAYSTETVNGVAGKPVPGAASIGSGNRNAAGYPGDGDRGPHDDAHALVGS